MYTFISNEFRQDMSVIEIFYEDNSHRSYLRDEFIGFTEFLCNNLHIWEFLSFEFSI